MRKQKQIVTLLLVAQLLTLVSCGGETAETQANTNSDTTTPAVDTGETEAKPDLPDVTWKDAPLPCTHALRRVSLNAFYDGRALFLGGVVRYAPGIIESSEIDFGILPMPKYTEEQTNYYSYSEVSNSTALLVPVVADLSDVSFMIEALSEESYRTVVPAYYEVMVKSKYSPDPNASEVLDLIFANHWFDTALLYSWLDISGIYDTILQKKENTFASQYASKSGAAQTKLEKWMKTLSEMKS